MACGILQVVNAAVQGKEMFLSTSESSLRVAIVETIGRYCESTGAPAVLQQSSNGDHGDQHGLLLGKSDASRARGAQGEAEDFSQLLNSSVHHGWSHMALVLTAAQVNARCVA